MANTKPKTRNKWTLKIKPIKVGFHFNSKEKEKAKPKVKKNESVVTVNADKSATPMALNGKPPSKYSQMSEEAKERAREKDRIRKAKQRMKRRLERLGLENITTTTEQVQNSDELQQEQATGSPTLSQPSPKEPTPEIEESSSEEEEVEEAPPVKPPPPKKPKIISLSRLLAREQQKVRRIFMTEEQKEKIRERDRIRKRLERAKRKQQQMTG